MDLDATIAFYEMLGFRAALQTVNEAADERVAFLKLGDVMVEAYENKQGVLGQWGVGRCCTECNGY